MSTRAAYETTTLPHPLTGEAIERDDLAALKAAYNATENYLRRPKIRMMWQARDAIQMRIAELNPIGLPRPSLQTDKQRRVDRCPRCKSILPQVSEPEPVPEPEPQAGADPARGADGLDSAGPESSGSESQSELLPTGQRTAEQEAALGVDIFGAPVKDPEPSPASTVAQAEEAPAPDGASDAGASSPLDAGTIAAGEFKVTRGPSTGKTVAEVVAADPAHCLRYLAGGKDEKLKAALTTWMWHVHPELMEDSK